MREKKSGNASKLLTESTLHAQTENKAKRKRNITFTNPPRRDGLPKECVQSLRVSTLIHFFGSRWCVIIILLGGFSHWSGSSILRCCLRLCLRLRVKHGVREYSGTGNELELPADVSDSFPVDDGVNSRIVEEGASVGTNVAECVSVSVMSVLVGVEFAVDVSFGDPVDLEVEIRVIVDDDHGVAVIAVAVGVRVDVFVRVPAFVDVIVRVNVAIGLSVSTVEGDGKFFCLRRRLGRCTCRSHGGSSRPRQRWTF